MPRRLTMLQVRNRCKRRSDKENDPHISDTEWNELINEQYGDLFLSVANTGLRYFEAFSTINATGAASYAEPTDLLSVVSIDKVNTDGTRYGLRELMVQERNRFAGQTGDALYYALSDDDIFLYPKPASGTYEMTYIPQSTDVSAYTDVDLLDVVTPDGEAFLIWGVAVKALAKSESDVMLAIQEREAARARLVEWATLRCFNSPRRRQIVEEDDLSVGDPGGWWNRG